MTEFRTESKEERNMELYIPQQNEQYTSVCQTSQNYKEYRGVARMAIVQIQVDEHLPSSKRQKVTY